VGKHLYILIGELPPGWTSSQRQKAWDALRRLGKQSDVQPCRVNHSRLSLDGRAIILEAEFAEDEISRDAIVATLSTALGVQPSAMDAKIDYRVFGGLDASWGESLEQCRAYLAANRAEWGSDLVS